jgi:ankyrin repeat protein
MSGLGQSPFWLAVNNGDATIVQLMLDSGKTYVRDWNWSSNENFRMACELAERKGHINNLALNLLKNDKI